MMSLNYLLIVLLLGCGEFVCRGQQQQTLGELGPVQIKVVRGAPFSAKVVTESIQTMGDGNRIVRSTTSTIARDSDGRTRRDQKLAGTGTSISSIQDPVAGFAYVLDTRDRSVRVTPVQKFEGIESLATTASGGESIGSEFIEGFLAEHTRLRQTITAEQAGSDKPFEVVLETWYSPQLQTIVRNRMIDPRIGMVDYRLTEIQLGEPTQLLFQPPKDYTVREEPRTFRPLVTEKSSEK